MSRPQDNFFYFGKREFEMSGI